MEVEQDAAAGAEAGGRPPPRFGADADPFALGCRNSWTVRLGLGSATTFWTGRAMPWVQSAGPSTEVSGPAPSMTVSQPEPGDTVAGARFHRVHEPGPAMGGLDGAHRKRVGSAASLAASAKPGISTARSRDSVTRTVAQGASSPAAHSVLSITLTRPPSVDDGKLRAQFRHRRRAQEPGRGEIAVPHFRCPACASTSAVSRLATAPPCSPRKGPAASAEGCQ